MFRIIRKDAVLPGSLSGAVLVSVLLATGFTRITVVVTPFDGVENVQKFGDLILKRMETMAQSISLENDDF